MHSTNPKQRCLSLCIPQTQNRDVFPCAFHKPKTETSFLVHSTNPKQRRLSFPPNAVLGASRLWTALQPIKQVSSDHNTCSTAILRKCTAIILVRIDTNAVYPSVLQVDEFLCRTLLYPSCSSRTFEPQRFCIHVHFVQTHVCFYFTWRSICRRGLCSQWQASVINKGVPSQLWVWPGEARERAAPLSQHWMPREVE